MFKRNVLSAAILGAGLLASTIPALADTYTFNATYYKVATGSPDFYNGDAPIGTTYNYVMPTLGPDGLPVFNTAYTTSSGMVNAPNSAYLNASNELLYFKAGGYVVADGSGTKVLSSTPTNMYPPAGAGTNNSTFEETAVLTSSFYIAAPNTPVTFSVGADDMAFVYVDGSLVESLGGIHGDTPAPGATVNYGVGTHSVEIFYADRDVSQASLSFSEVGSSVPVSPVPEPSSFLLLGSGLLGVAGAVRRRILA